MPVILLSPLPGDPHGSDYQVSSHDPHELVEFFENCLAIREP